ncbi:MAG: MBL fold metallo-hydrolase [Candidatus Thiodiazotropha sp.]|jgi:7,8-dihydropterin-6-yl-methyl-4-(beta-D-ribofuranosyl)aminobenzene 5'-phosphate synthase
MQTLSDLSLTLLFDNVCHEAQLPSLWGFSLLVELSGKRLLFDTGSNGRVLLKNCEMLGVSPIELDFLFISHGHWDHTGGIDSILELNPDLTLVVPVSLSPRWIDDLRQQCSKLILVDQEPVTFAPGFSSTGVFPGEMPEQALVIPSDQGAVVITGCAHPGIGAIAKEASRQNSQAIALLAGGFHLFKAQEKEIDAVINELANLPVQYIMPTHCTGSLASSCLKKQFGVRCIAGGSGQRIRFNSAGQPVL